jgi:hypothetical protein
METRDIFVLKEQLSSGYFCGRKCSFTNMLVWKGKLVTSKKKEKTCSESLNEEYQETFVAQLKKMAHEGQCVTMDFINYTKNKIR